MRARSCLAMQPRIAITASLNGPHESMKGSRKDRKATPYLVSWLRHWRVRNTFTGEAVQRPEQQHIETPLSRVTQHAEELGPGGVTAALVIDVLDSHLPTLGDGEPPEVVKLVLYFLSSGGGAHPPVDSRATREFGSVLCLAPPDCTNPENASIISAAGMRALPLLPAGCLCGYFIGTSVLATVTDSGIGRGGHSNRSVRDHSRRTRKGIRTGNSR
jgi:hypothetical protein